MLPWFTDHIFTVSTQMASKHGLSDLGNISLKIDFLNRFYYIYWLKCHRFLDWTFMKYSCFSEQNLHVFSCQYIEHFYFWVNNLWNMNIHTIIKLCKIPDDLEGNFAKVLNACSFFLRLMTTPDVNIRFLEWNQLRTNYE